MVYGLYRALPGDRAFLPPSPPRSLLLKDLMPASGHQDHTALPSALALFVKSAAASIASSPASVTIAIRPSSGVDGETSTLIWVFGKSEYFSREGLTEGSENQQVICPSRLGKNSAFL